MPSADILSRIRQGDPNVLTSILNHSLRPYGIRAQVVHRENCLHVLLESEKPPDFQVWVPMLQRVMRHLGIQAVGKVKVYGHQTDNPAVAWKREFTLVSPDPNSLVRAMSSVAPPEAIRTLGIHAEVDPSFASEVVQSESATSSEPSVEAASRLESLAPVISVESAQGTAISEENAAIAPQEFPQTAEPADAPETFLERAIVGETSLAAVLNTAESTEIVENEAQPSEVPSKVRPVDDSDTLTRTSDPDSAPLDDIFPLLDNVDLFQASEPSMPDTTDSSVPAASTSEELELPFDSDAELLKRPESVVLVLFVTLLMFWQLYLALAEGTDSNAIPTSKLADRLSVSRSTIRRRKYREDFAEWSRSRDPEGKAWMAWGSRFLPLD